MLGRVEDVGSRTLFDRDTALHDDRRVGDLAHDGQVVADQDVADPGRRADVGEQVQDLRLDRDVEGGDGLVQQQDARLGGEGAGDRDPLALAAREGAAGARSAGGRPGRPGRPAPPPRAARSAAVRIEVQPQHLVDARGRRLARVERAVRDPGRRSGSRGRAGAAPTPARAGALRSASGDRDPSRRRRLQADEHPRERRLARAGLADDRQRLALCRRRS